MVLHPQRHPLRPEPAGLFLTEQGHLPSKSFPSSVIPFLCLLELSAVRRQVTGGRLQMLIKYFIVALLGLECEGGRIVRRYYPRDRISRCIILGMAKYNRG